MDFPVKLLRASNDSPQHVESRSAQPGIDQAHRSFSGLLKRLLRGLSQLVLIWSGALAAALLLVPHDSRAESLDPALQERIRAYVTLAMQTHPMVRSNAANNVTPRVQVEIGAIDSRLRLAPCSRIEPYLPSGLKLGGASRIGLRCMEGPTAWRITLPVQVQVLGRGLVALNGIQAGALLSAQDVAMGDIDLVAETSAPLRDAQALEGRIAARSLTAGQSIRQSHLKPRQWFAAGDMVRVLAAGEGYAVAGQGQALTPGIEGQPAKVRTEAGRIVSGTAVAERQLSLDL